jgi:hypothetical protein
MSPFWQDFNANRKLRDEEVNSFRETLAEVCQTFALADLPATRKRGVLMRELRRLCDHYQDWRNWDDDRTS